MAFFLKLESSTPIGLSQSQHREPLLWVPSSVLRAVCNSQQNLALLPSLSIQVEAKDEALNKRRSPRLAILSPAHSCESNAISVEDPLNGLAGTSVLIQATPDAATDSVPRIAGSMHSIHPHFLGRGILGNVLNGTLKQEALSYTNLLCFLCHPSKITSLKSCPSLFKTVIEIICKIKLSTNIETNLTVFVGISLDY